MFFFEFKFRIKGSYFYSTNHLLNEKLLIKNQSLKPNVELNNPFDIHAITLWLPFKNLPHSLQNHQTLEHEKWQMRLLNYQYLYRLPTKLSRKLSTSYPLTKTNPASRLKPNQIHFKNLHWHFEAHQWLIGYLPRRLAKLLNPSNPQALINSSKLNSSRLNLSQLDLTQLNLTQSNITITHIESAGQIFAKLELPCSVFQMIKLAIQLINSKHRNEFSWKLKFQRK